MLVDKKSEIKVLLVDDKQENLDALEAVLASICKIDKTNSGERALKLLLNNEYACCLLDIRMPRMDGFQLAEIIRRDPYHQYTPIIFVTAEANDRDSVFTGYERGAVDFVLKPLEPQIIRSKVSVFVDLYRYRKSHEKTEEIKNLNQKLDTLNKKLSVANNDLSYFTRMAAHHMQEPIKRIINFTELIELEQDNLSEESRVYFEKIKSSILYLHRMINDFRTLTGVDYDEPVRTTENLNQIIDDCLNWYKEEINSHKINIEKDILPTEFSVYKSLVARLYDNLIKNAIEHAHQSKFTIKLTARREENNKWVFGVYNTGAKVNLANINDIFLDNNSNDKKKYSGFGLSICKKIVERHHGMIWAEADSKGLHIIFTLEEK